MNQNPNMAAVGVLFVILVAIAMAAAAWGLMLIVGILSASNVVAGTLSFTSSYAVVAIVSGLRFIGALVTFSTKRNK
jgi:hypothetical protein